MDGVRKKAKYLHDAPDGALMPGVGGHYPHMNGIRPVPVPTHDQGAVAAAQQGAYFTQAPSTTYYAQNTTPGQTVAVQDPSYSNPQAPISPQYGQNTQAAMAAAAAAPAPVSQGTSSQLQQFGGPLFDPSDPALFNFDISSLNFGNHYGALELGMLGHMSSAAIDAPAGDNPLNQAAHVYNGPMGSASYAEPHGLPAHVSFGQDGLPSADWQNPHSRHGSLQVHTPNNTPVTMDRHDSLNGPMAYAIGQGGPSSLSSASPASMDYNAGYDNENPMSAATFFANANQSQSRGSPTTHRPHQDSRPPGGPLYQMHPNAGRKRQSKLIYEKVTKPYNYPSAHHRLVVACSRRFSRKNQDSVRTSLGRFRPSLLINASHLDSDDLIHAEKNLQRSLISMLECFGEVGTPSLIVRRTGEVVGTNKEFEILTGWKREVLLGTEPNLNANLGSSQQRANESGLSSQNSTTPTLPGQEPEAGPYPVNIVELLDEPSAVEYLSDFADLATADPLGRGHRRVNFLRYQTKEDLVREAERPRGANGDRVKYEPLVKQEDGTIHRGEAMRSLGAHNGLIDSMIMWHIKRDNFDMPMLVAFQVCRCSCHLRCVMLLTWLIDHACAERNTIMFRVKKMVLSLLQIQAWVKLKGKEIPFARLNLPDIHIKHTYTMANLLSTTLCFRPFGSVIPQCVRRHHLHSGFWAENFVL